MRTATPIGVARRPPGWPLQRPVLPTNRLLLDLLHDGPPDLRSEALRSLRGLLDKSEAERLIPDLRAAVAKPELGTPDDRREWAEQMLLAFKATPHALARPNARNCKSSPAPGRIGSSLADGARRKGRPRRRPAGLLPLRVPPGASSATWSTTAAAAVGPDLSHVGAAMDRRKIVESILDPSREIAPMYVPMVFTLRNGDVVTGIAGLEDVGADFVQVRDATGKATRIRQDDIVARRQEKVWSCRRTCRGLTVREFRDLVEFLARAEVKTGSPRRRGGRGEKLLALRPQDASNNVSWRQ